MTYRSLVMDINKAIVRMASVVEIAETEDLEKLLLGYVEVLEKVARIEGALDILNTLYYGVNEFDEYMWAFNQAKAEFDIDILSARYRIRDALS